MKNKVLTILLLLFLIFIKENCIYASSKNTNYCKSLQALSVLTKENLKKIRSCTPATIGYSPVYLFKNIELGYCHYFKIDTSQGLPFQISSECYAPASEIYTFANNYIDSLEISCTDKKINFPNKTAPELSILDKYCK